VALGGTTPPARRKGGERGKILCCVVPVVIVNVSPSGMIWEWTEPEVNEKLFGKKRETWGLWDRKIDE
jgi:hypothetical protein